MSGTATERRAGPPASANSQHQRIESILEAAGAAGVHDAHFLFTLHWTQFRARIDEMNDLGWVIESVPLPKSQWQHGVRTKHVLRSKPLEVAPGEDWYEKLKGKPRPSETSSNLSPLFDGQGAS